MEGIAIMFRASCASAVARRSGALCACLALLAGCSTREPLERAGVTISVPEGWKSVPVDTWPVTGQPVAAWSGPGGSSLVVFTRLPDPEGKPESIATSLTTRLENLPELKFISSAVETVAGLPSARIEAVAPGDGASFAPSGTGKPIGAPGKALVLTRRIVVAFPRANDILTLIWHTPESQAETLEEQVALTLKTLKIDRGQSERSSY
jgi:hypothetical protein